MTSADSVAETASIASEEKSEADLQKSWRFKQWFKKVAVDEATPDSDILSAVEFDKSGNFLATGDRGGRVVILKGDNGGKQAGNGIHFKFFSEFQSHEIEYDYVRAQTVEEKINQIKFLQPTSGQLLLTTNDRLIKMWKVEEKEIKYAMGFNTKTDKGQPKSMKKLKQLKLPRLEVADCLVTATPIRHYGTLHRFNIHSLNVSSDGETFLSSDNLTINRWSLEKTDVSYTITDIRPENMAELQEVITVTEMDSFDPNLFMYGTNRGTIRLGDMREKAINDYPKRVFTDPKLEEMDRKAGLNGANGTRPFLQDMLRSISDIKFSQEGRYIVARDYMYVKVWDSRMENKPAEIIQVHEFLNPKLWDLYENEYIFDCFDVAVNANGDIATGSYNNFFHMFDLDHQTDTLIEASKPPLATGTINSTDGNPRDSRIKSMKKKRMSRPNLGSLLGRKKRSNKGRSHDSGNVFADVDIHNLNFENRVMKLAYHPNCNTIAVASANNLFVYAR